jgi:hypothetical protein
MKCVFANCSAAIVLGASGQALALDPPPGLTKTVAGAEFAKAVVNACLASRLRGVSIKDLSEGERGGLQPAAPADRHGSPLAKPSDPVWETPAVGFILSVAEPSLSQCIVTAQQIPVAASFAAATRLASDRFADFQNVPVKSGYWPVVYQLQRIEGDSRYTICLEGAEPGAGLTHAFRFSLLAAYVVKQPVVAKPNCHPPAG